MKKLLNKLFIVVFLPFMLMSHQSYASWHNNGAQTTYPLSGNVLTPRWCWAESNFPCNQNFRCTAQGNPGSWASGCSATGLCGSGNNHNVGAGGTRFFGPSTHICCNHIGWRRAIDTIDWQIITGGRRWVTFMTACLEEVRYTVTRCNAGRHVSGNNCPLCPGGTIVPNSELSRWSPSFLFTTNIYSHGLESCIPCGTNQISNAARTECITCGPGTGPNTAGTACIQSCPGGQFASGGGCAPCPPLPAPNQSVVINSASPRERREDCYVMGGVFGYRIMVDAAGNTFRFAANCAWVYRS